MRAYKIFAIMGKALGLRDIIMKIGRDSIRNFERRLYFGFKRRKEVIRVVKRKMGLKERARLALIISADG